MEEAVVDCGPRLAVCRAACCRLRFEPAAGDVVERDHEHPHLNAQGPDGWCAHLDRGAEAPVRFGRCTVYERRPAPCRAFDCRRDPRIWADYDAIVPAASLRVLLEGRPTPAKTIRLDFPPPPEA